MLFILLVLIGVGFIYWTWKEDTENLGLCCIATFIFGGLSSLLILAAAPNVVIKKEIKTERIYSLTNNNKFTLGIRNFNTSERYYTFTKTESGGFNRLTFNSEGGKFAEGCTLFQDEDKNPYYSKTIIYSTLSKWFWPFQHILIDTTNFEIHIPRNTIIEKYQVE